MLKNYLKIALRTLLKHKGYSTLNLVGLTIGMAACLLIALYVQHQLSYDRYHVAAERIYRLVQQNSPKVGAQWGPALEQEFPEILKTTRFLHESSSAPLVATGVKQFYESAFLYADAGALEIFSWPLVRGNPATALLEPYTLVLTEETARKYFGDQDPIGQSVSVDGRDFRITGVLQEVPRQSHFRFDFLASFATVTALADAGEWGTPMDWTNSIIPTYLLLNTPKDVSAVHAKLDDFIHRHISAPNFNLTANDYTLQPLADVHLKSNFSDDNATDLSSITYVYLFSALGALILMIACFNFMNLSTARSQVRAREVGMRKVLGAYRRQLVKQFLSESILLSLLAFVFALLVVYLALPYFNQLTGQSLTGESLWQGIVIGIIVALALLVGTLSGSYPAFILSGFKPAVVLKGKRSSHSSGALLRSFLVVAQFAISVTLITATAIVYSQLDFLHNKNLGFQKEQIVVMPLGGSQGVRQQLDAFGQRLRQHPRILQTSATHSLPGQFLNQFSSVRFGDHSNQKILLGSLWIDHNFVSLFGMEVIAGRDFSVEFGTDSAGVILNESAVRRFGWSPDDAVGRSIRWIGGPRSQDIVIGVVKDFHYRSLHEPIPALAMSILPYKNFFSIRVRPEDLQSTLSFAEQTWNDFEPNFPFVYYFLDESFAKRYKAEERLAKTFAVLSALAIFTGCLGLFGLAAFSAQERTREIGVRKVLGASVSGLIVMLTGDFTKLILAAILVATPFSYLFITDWLQQFAYRVDLGLGVFVFGGAMALAIAWLTVGYQAARAALTNPIRALRHE